MTTSSGVSINPDTSMTITITDLSGDTIIDAVAMTNDDTGEYHYDYNPESDAEIGAYKIRYKATHSSRLTIVDDYFTMRA